MLDDAQKVHGRLLKNHQEVLKARQEEIYNKDAVKAAEGNGTDSAELKKGLKTMGNIDPGKQEEALDMLILSKAPRQLYLCIVTATLNL